MDQLGFTERIKGIILPVIEEEDILLVELYFVRTRGSSLLRLLVDRKGGGITLDDCSRLNEKIGLVLDNANILEERYTLEVSSPGLDRPLKTKNDFLRCLGREVNFFLKEPINGKMEMSGKVKDAGEDSVNIDVNGIILEIPLLNIAKAKQVIKGRLK